MQNAFNFVDHDEDGLINEHQLATILERYQLKPSQIGLELTESVLLDERAGDMGPRLQAPRPSRDGLDSPR